MLANELEPLVSEVLHIGPIFKSEKNARYCNGRGSVPTKPIIYTNNNQISKLR